MAYRVLVCDDSIGFPALVRTWLSEDDRFEVVGLARGGEEARRMVAQTQPDLLVLDLVLPDVPDAPALVGALRELHPPLRVMLVSSLPMDALAHAATAAGANGACTKGATAAELTGRLYDVASGAGSDTQNRLP